MLLDSSKVKDFLCENDLALAQQVGVDITLRDARKVIRTNNNAILKETSVRDEDMYQPIDQVPYVRQNGKRGFLFEAGNAYEIIFNEVAKLDAYVAGFVVHRSSVARLGNSIISGVYDPGFNGRIGATLICHNDMFVEIGARLAQFILYECYESPLYGNHEKKFDNYPS